ncbi:MAG: cell division protein FtsL [Treponema sp.]|nr:cell division protein FtsL [Treponema sp.]
MIRRYAILYFFILTIPLFLGITVWQSVRYRELDRNVRRLEAIQENWLESNRNLVAGIAVLSSSARIEQVAVNDLRLPRIRPEDVLQIQISSLDSGGQRN